MAQAEEMVSLAVSKRGKNNKARGVIYAGKEHKIGEKFTAKKSDANFLIASGKCELAKDEAKK